MNAENENAAPAVCTACGADVGANALHTYWKIPFKGDGQTGPMEGEIWVSVTRPENGHLCRACALTALFRAAKELVEGR